MLHLYHRYQIVSCLAALVAMLTFSVGTRDPLIALLAVPATLTSLVMFRHNTLSPVPRWLINLLLVCATLSVLRVFGAEPGRVVAILGQFLVWLLVIKLFESHTPRNQGPSIVLALLLIVAAVLSDVTLAIGLMLLVFAPLALSWTVLFQMYSAAYRAHAAVHAAGWASNDRSRPPFPLTLTPRALQQSRRLVLAGATVAILCAAVIFIIMPRIGEGALGGLPTGTENARTGLASDFIQLGSEANIRESDQRVLSARIDRVVTRVGDGGVSEAALGVQTTGPFLLRAIVLDTYRPQQGTWERSEQMSEAAVRFDATSGPPTRTPLAEPLGYPSVRGIAALLRNGDAAFRIEIRPLLTARAELLTMWAPLGISIDSPQPQRFAVNPLDGLATRSAQRAGARDYTVFAVQDPQRGMLPGVAQAARARSFNPSALQRWYLEEPLHENPFLTSEELAPIRQLADDILTEAGITPQIDDAWFDTVGLPRLIGQRVPPPANAADIARAFTQHLEFNYAYTLDLTRADTSADPIVDFLFNTRQGHCEYFASALAGLLRATNINARVVLGYVATEYDPVEQAFVVRERHAHAWVEAETSPGRWETFDPSPQAETSIAHTPEDTFFAGLRRWFDRAESLWIRSVISFDQENQAELLGMQDDGSIEMLARLRSVFSRNPDERNHLARMLQSAVAVLITIVGLALATAAGYLLWRRASAIFRRRDAHHDRAPRTARDDPPFYTDALAALKSAGLEKPDTLPPREHARRLTTAGDAAGSLFADITTRYYDHRFGPGELSHDEHAAATRIVERLREALSGRASTESTP